MQQNTKKRLQKVTTTLLAVTMTMSAAPMVLAAESTEPVTVLSSNTQSGISPVFSDVKLGHWAEKHIHKLAALGILKGNNGKFRPNDDITQQEAVTLAIRFMGLEGELNEESSVALPSEIKVGNYFKSYVVLALQKGLLDLEDEVVNTDPKVSWGEKKATREWITKILVRAVGKESAAEAVMSMPTSFADNSDISKDKLGYVNVAVDLKLTSGVDKNRFAPKATVTRAQIATFFSRGDAIANVKYNSEIYGIVSNISDSQIRLYSENNRWETSRVNSETMWYQSDSETAITAADIPMYTKIRLIGSGGSAAYVELVDSKQQVETLQATLKYAEDKTLWVKLNGQSGLTEITLDSNTIKGTNGENVLITSLPENSELSIVRETFSTEQNVIDVQVKSAPVSKTSSGKISSIDTATRTLKIVTDAGNIETYTVDKDARISYDNTILTINDLKSNDAVTYTVKNDVVTSIVLTSTPEVTIEGQLFELGSNKSLITVKTDNGKFESKMLASVVDVKIEGMTNASIDHLLADSEYGDRVKITVNSESKVTRIEVVSRKVNSLYGVTITNYDATKKWLTISDGTKLPITLQIDDATQYDMNGTKVTAQVGLSMLVPNRKVNIQYTGQNVLSVQSVYKYEGTLIAASASTKTITMELANKDIITVPYEASLFVDIYGSSLASITDLKRGDYVSAMLNSNQSSIITIAVRSTNQFETSAVNTSSNRITLRDTNQKTSEYSLSSVSVYGLNDERITVSNIQPGDVFNAVFDGRNLIELRKVAVTSGRIQSVDAAGGVVVVKANDGTLHTYTTSSGLSIVMNNATSSIAALKEGDRVEGRKDTAGKAVLKVIPGVAKTFWKYDANSKELYVKRSSLSETNYYFKLAANVDIHDKAGNTLAVTSLKDGDSLVLYFLNDQIIEIEKQ